MVLVPIQLPLVLQAMRSGKDAGDGVGVGRLALPLLLTVAGVHPMSSFSLSLNGLPIQEDQY